jgi:asparagine synthase (glutamine-hydrolysing)
MCGIVGVVQRKPVDGLLGPMMEKLAHRGPDGWGEWTGEWRGWQIGLGHRRLAILDIEGGRQPMASEDAALQITFNGEIYNFAALRRELEAAGHRFATRSDTEVLLHHFDQNGFEGLESVNGQFAFACWDARQGRLSLVRDRFGIKPLFWTALPDGGLAFASELTALLAHPEVKRALCPEGLLSYLFSDYAHPPTTLVRGVQKLAPGHAFCWSNGVVQAPQRFWRLSVGDQAPQASADDLSAELWRRLGDSVQRQLVADVPVGVFLSGGIDSSTIAVLARERHPGRLRTFSIGFEDRAFDESPCARLLAKQMGTEHVEEILSEGNLLEVVDEALEKLDEPLADHSLIPTFLLSRLAARHVKVVLGGDGGDELLGGYPTYRAHGAAPLFALIPERARRGLASLVRRLPSIGGYQSLDWKLKRFVGRFDEEAGLRHLRWMSAVDLPELAAAVPGARGSPAVLRQEVPPSSDGLNRLLALDFLTYLPGSVLAKVDRASMAHGLEVRPPFLDNEVVSWAFSLPSSLKVKRGVGKWLLKRAAEGRVPERIVRRPKRGFSIPLAAWLRGPLRTALEEVLASSRLWRGALNRELFCSFADEHKKRRGDHAKALWALLVLDRWVRRERIDVG